jgi:hypothetical protein
LSESQWIRHFKESEPAVLLDNALQQDKEQADEAIPELDEEDIP